MTMINSVVLRAMTEELAEIRKEAGFGSMLGSVGGKIMGGGMKALKGVAGGGGRFADLASKAHGAAKGGIVKGVQQFGGKNLKRGVGAAALGAGALGAGAVAAGGAKALRRPQPTGYR